MLDRRGSQRLLRLVVSALLAITMVAFGLVASGLPAQASSCGTNSYGAPVVVVATLPGTASVTVAWQDRCIGDTPDYFQLSTYYVAGVDGAKALGPISDSCRCGSLVETPPAGVLLSYCIAGVYQRDAALNDTTCSSPIASAAIADDPYASVRPHQSGYIDCDVDHTPVDPTLSDLPDGGRAYSYRVGGEVIVQNMTPLNFSALDASAAELALYNLPAQPTDPEELKSWTAELTAFDGFASPGMCHTGQMAGGTTATTGTSGPASLSTNNWSGGLLGPGSHAYTYVRTDFTVPNLRACSCTDARETTWAGLGGVSGASLLQDGVDSGGGGNAPFAWIEEYPGGCTSSCGSEMKVGLSVHYGERIQAITSVDATPANKVCFTVKNLTDSSAKPYASCSSVSATYHQTYHTAEVIGERPTVVATGGLYPLRTVSDIDFGNTAIRDTATGIVNFSDRYTKKVIMTTDGSGTSPLMMGPTTGPSGGGLVDHWVLCQ